MCAWLAVYTNDDGDNDGGRANTRLKIAKLARVDPGNLNSLGTRSCSEIISE